MNISEEDITLFNLTLRKYSDYDFSDYSEKSIRRRLAKVLVDQRMEITKLLALIKRDKEFTEQIVKDITVNTTELFRDPEVWHMLRFRVLPNYKGHKKINIWHTGCSTGQEVYSMLILLNELNLFEKSNVYASDINSDVLDKTLKGVYKYRFNINYLDNFDKVIKENPYNFDDYNDVPYSKYFTIDKVKDTITMHKFLRDKISCKKQDLVKDENVFYRKFDIIFCRNVIIYFNHKLQNKVFHLFHENLFNSGHLVLGKQETMRGGISGNFEKHGQIYTKKR